MITQGEFVKLTWDTVANFVTYAIAKILELNFPCTAHSDASDYWAIQLEDRIDMKKLDKICDYIGASDSDRRETFPKDEFEKNRGTKSLGMGIASKLLRLKVGYTWEAAFPTEDALWLVGCKKNESFTLCGTTVYLDMLKGKDELLDYMMAHGCNHDSIHQFTKVYQDRYQSQLFWHVPYCPGEDHLGVYFVLVKEGVLMLPYDDADKISGAKFHPEYASFVNASTVFKYLHDFNSFASNVDCGLESLNELLQRRERGDE